MMGNASSPLGAQRGRCCPLLGIGDHRALPQRHAESCRWAGLEALTVDDSLRSQQAASDRVRAAGVDGLPPQGAAAALEQHCDRGLAMPHSVPAMGGRSFGRRSGLAPSMEGYHPPEHFDPLWKLFYMWEHPSHFPLATWTALTDWGDRLWPELIGILGWQDILLRPWIYVVLTVFLMLVPLQKLQLHGASRARVAVMTGFGVLGYVAVVYLIFFLTYTPLDVDHVRGVQGRYFVIALPVAAIFVAAVINREVPEGMPAAIAIAGSMIAGIATVEALLQAHW